MKVRGRCYLKQKNYNKNSRYILTLTIKDVLGEQNVMHDDHISLREALVNYINSTKNDF